MRDVLPRDLSIIPAGAAEGFLDYLCSRDDGLEVAFLYAKAFWPDIIEVDGFIFIAENHDPDYHARVLAEYGEGQLEATINTTYLENLFGAGEVKREVVEALGGQLSELWVSRAKSLFPDRDFVAHFAWYSGDGDPGVVLHQWKWPCADCSTPGMPKGEG